MRPQEFVESPDARFKGRYFTLDKFKAAYAKTYGNGRFSYYQDYQGYNFPGERFLDWQVAFAGNETEDEQALLRLLGPLPDRFYLIGALSRDAGTLQHELSHALFHLVDEYRERVTAELVIYSDGVKMLKRALRRLSYAEEVLDDECVSYVLFEDAWMRRAGVRTSLLAALKARLMSAYRMNAFLFLKPRREW